jgi:aspartyl protease family protein
VAAGPGSSLPRALRWGHMGILAFWLAVMGVVWVGMEFAMKPRAAVITAEGELKIPRHRDGHFYVAGTVNGRPITFMVDTGASSVAVSEGFAKDARLPPGLPLTLQTANGTLQGSSVRDVPVSAGPFSLSSTTVAVGLVGDRDDRGLLGQSFLSKFDMSVSRKEMILRRP